MYRRHRKLVRGFFKNASSMLWPDGEIHVNHKITAPFSNWKIEELASEYSLILTELDDFKIEHYPDYNNKRGSVQHQLVPFDHRFSECHWIFGRYLNHIEDTFRSISYDVHSCVREALRVGFETYTRAVPESGYIGVLEQLHHLSIMTSQRLRNMLLQLDQQLI
ncbi:hypothetical protein BUALT_Bualt03G0101000 [Buddleja alternifolia]|uniref:25S rRNA (uridine-N(3))-methyltransferase BMT5-like domain-containing protein n=1 Tax=Buddleja alternifolia TaxID=168488 RepID=A0AAV6Y3B2_9LAMI|nr:hypothetical protein BUALT_Bualt03G0101000 [Buddleja alternifolia]